MLPGWLAGFPADGGLLFLTCGIRTFAYGFLSVVLGLYLAALGLTAPTIGGIFTAALAGGAVMTIGLTAVADRFGRRRVLVLAALLMVLGAVVFALSSNLMVLTAAALFGAVSPSGKEVGPFLALEQAVLPQVSGHQHRTSVFAVYNLVASGSGALGALAVAVPSVFGLEGLSGYRSLVWAYAGLAALLALLFSRLSPAIEVAPAKAGRLRAPARFSLGLRGSSRTVAKLAGLFAVDAFAGGFVIQSLIAYWFHSRYGFDIRMLGALFFGTNLLAALSFLAAAPIARRFGLLNTMVFTHLPSNVLLILVPLMPNAELAMAALLARFLLSQLDVPTRQSYTMAVVEPDERSAAAGVTSVVRNAAAALAPALSGAALRSPALGLPFLIAGALKSLYDLALLWTFHGVRPPEEAEDQPSAALAGDKG